MKKSIIFVLMLIIGSGIPGISKSQELTPESLRNIATTFDYFIVLEETADSPLRYLYADTGPHIHVYTIENGKSVLVWESTVLGSAITACLVKDLNGDGKETIIVATANGRILAYDAHNYDLLFENFNDPFNSISCLTIANLDDDMQEEAIFIADGKLNIYDCATRFLQWRSHRSVQATEILVANVDDDKQLEIILNSGYVIDSRFYTLEKANVGAGAFGNKMRLLDMNGDGYPEIIGETVSRQLKVYDLYAGREVW